MFESPSKGPHNIQHPLPHGRKSLGFFASSFPRLGKHIKLPDVDNESDQKCPDESFASLKQDVAQLQERLLFLGTDETRAQLVAAIKEKDLRAEEKEQHLQALNEKLRRIQMGLHEIEGERYQLVRKASHLEGEKSRLSETLLKREQEIAELQHRCSAHAIRSEEHSELRSANGQLLKMVSDLQAQQEAQIIEYPEHRTLQQLRQHEAAHAAVLERLKETQLEHESVCAHLEKCIVSVERLTKEKKGWEKERAILLNESKSKLENQRLSHVESCMHLKKDIEFRRLKVINLERNVEEMSLLISSLRQQLVDLQSSQKSTILQLETEFARKQCDVTNQLKSEFEQNQRVREEHHTCLENMLKSKLEERSLEIDTLREDVSSQMQKLMVTTTELQKCQEDSKLLAGLMEDVEVLEHEKFHLRENLHEKETEIAELSATILKLEIELELSEEHRNKSNATQSKLMAAEKDKAVLQKEIHLVNARHTDVMHAISAEHDSIVSSLRQKLESAKDSASMQLSIHREAMLAKNATIQTFVSRETAEKAKIACLEEQVLSLSGALAVKADNSHEQIEQSQDEFTQLSKSYRVGNLKSHETSEQLQSEVQALQCLTERLKTTETELQDTIRKRDETISGLKQHSNSIESALSDTELRLREEENLKNHAEVQTASLQTRQIGMLHENGRLRETLQEAKTERTNFVSSSDCNLGALAIAEQKVMNQQLEMGSLEDALRQRSESMSQLAAENNRLQVQISSDYSHFRELQEKCSLLHVQLQDATCELKRSKEKWTEDEDKFLEEIHEERNARELAESNLLNVVSQVHADQTEQKKSSELEKENQVLRDKVRRQKAYLERKIKQERIVRGRSPGCILTSSNRKTPGSSRCIGLHVVSPSTPSVATKSTVSESDSLDFALDCILSD